MTAIAAIARSIPAAQSEGDDVLTSGLGSGMDLVKRCQAFEGDDKIHISD